jgi:hypothetical protein
MHFLLCCSPVGALEAKEWHLFSGTVLGGFEAPVLENCSYAADMGYPVSSGEKTRVPAEIEEAEDHCYKSNKNLWLNKVSDKGDALMFQLAHNWNDQPVPEEEKRKLSENPKAIDGKKERSWVMLVDVETKKK